jgi:hypothetical protein
MFIVSAVDSPITQGDIVNECPLVGLDVPEPPSDLRNIPVQRWRATIIVLTQACDLAQAKSGRVLVAQVHDAQKLVESGVFKGTVVRDQMRRHLVFGWYFLPATTVPVALPESLIDLRDVHSVPRLMLEQLIKDEKRVASLIHACGLAGTIRHATVKRARQDSSAGLKNPMSQLRKK